MSINISELIWTVICFFVLLVVLKKLLFDPLVSFMAARDARIQDGISAGRTAQQQLDAAAQARSDARRQIALILRNGGTVPDDLWQQSGYSAVTIAAMLRGRKG